MFCKFCKLTLLKNISQYLNSWTFDRTCDNLKIIKILCKSSARVSSCSPANSMTALMWLTDSWRRTTSREWATLWTWWWSVVTTALVSVLVAMVDSCWPVMMMSMKSTRQSARFVAVSFTMLLLAVHNTLIVLQLCNSLYWSWLQFILCFPCSIVYLGYKAFVFGAYAIQLNWETNACDERDTVGVWPSRHTDTHQ